MIRANKKYSFSFLLFCIFYAGIIKPHKADSLLLLLKTDKEDSVKVNHLNLLSWELKYKNIDSSILLAKQSLLLAQRRKFEKGFGKANSNLGAYYSIQGDYELALKHHFTGMKINEKLGDKKGCAASYGNIGVVYRNKGDYPQALKYYFKALHINEELKIKKGIATNLGNIGVVYMNALDYEKALEYYFRALKIDEELNFKSGISRHYDNIATIYYHQLKFAEARFYYQRSLKLREELGELTEACKTTGNLGSVYRELKDYDSAVFYYEKTLVLAKKLGLRKEIALTTGNLGEIYDLQKNYPLAEKYLEESLKLFKDQGSLDDELKFEKAISDLYRRTSAYKKSLEHYKKYTQLKDSLFSTEKNKELTRHEMNYGFQKKEAAMKAEKEKNEAVAKAENKKQKILIVLTVSGLLLMLITLAVIYRSLRMTRKQKNIIEKQKEIADEKQKEILDSIYYARRIQRALITNEKYIDRVLKSKIK